MPTQPPKGPAATWVPLCPLGAPCPEKLRVTRSRADATGWGMGRRWWPGCLRPTRGLSGHLLVGALWARSPARGAPRTPQPTQGAHFPELPRPLEQRLPPTHLQRPWLGPEGNRAVG